MKRIRLFAFGILALALVILSACGGSGGGEGVMNTGATLYQQNFSGLSDGAAWSDSWMLAQGSNVVSAMIQSEEACLQGLQHTAADSGEMNLAGLVKTNVQVQNVDIMFLASEGNSAS